MKSFTQPKQSSRAEIVLDARMAHYSGIGTYVRGLLGEYQKHPFFEKRSLGLALSPSLSLEGTEPFRRFSFYSPIYSLREQLEYPFQFRRCRLWHAPHYNVSLIKQGIFLVVTIHDLIHWIFRKQFYSTMQTIYARIFLERAVRLADRIIAVSQNTRDDLVKYFKASPDKIRVIYEGVSPEFFKQTNGQERRQILEKYKLPENFFLYVGLIKPHKNVRRLVSVFEGLQAESKIRSCLVLVGKKDRRYPKGFEILRELKTGKGIHYIPEVKSQKELHVLYASARALIQPSYYEGFGLTCLEAMASGTPVIVSRTASLPEVVGQAGRYMDPYSDASLRDAIQEMDENESLREELISRAKIRAREFSWAKTAQETVKVYEEVLGACK